MQLEDWRKKIDALDLEFLNLINLRAELALEIGKLKQATGAACHVPARESEILARLRQQNPGPLADAAVERIYRQILSESVQLQEKAAVR